MAEARGLTSAEAARRLETRGPNELVHEEGPSVVRLLLRQIANPLVGLLLVAIAVAAFLGETADAVAIAAIVVLDAVVGFVQEFRAERALQALRGMTAPRARVLRDGRVVTIPAREVVPGDVLVLEAGDVVAADARLVEAHALTVNEAALTGESLPVDKSTEPVLPDAPLAERSDHVFLGTHVASGTGRAEVVATGMDTEMGRIAELLSEAGADRRTPLEEQLAHVSRTLMVVCLGVVAVIAVLGLLRGEDAVTVLMRALSLAVAAVPEGLPAVVTIALALGVRRMAARHVLVRRLSAVETLGATRVICTDKTGTLTTGVMTVREVWGPDGDAVLRAAAACCDAEIGPGDHASGDPTEVAILRAAAVRGFTRERIEAENPRVHVQPFDPDLKRMAILRADGVLYVKGAAERLVERSSRGTEGVAEAVREMGSRGLRVLGVAVGEGKEVADLEFLGLLGLADPPRPEAIRAVVEARRGGITTVMITGDHPVTAQAIARELGILRQGDDPELLVHARATPEDKIRVVREWKAKGAIVAMTGDGVNDAPAVREAHVGIAMGITGTEVTREAAAVILTDDNFASIVEGVKEGRAIYENIRQTVIYLLSGNAGELAIMLVAGLTGLPVPLLPLHLLWINLVTDGPPALALVVDPPDDDVLARPPRDPSRPLLDRAAAVQVLATGALEASVALGAFLWSLDQGLDVARSMAFTTLVFGELLRAFAARSPDRVFFELGVFTNLMLLVVVVVSGAVQVLLTQVPFLATWLGFAPMTASDVAIAVALGLIPVSALEITKLLRRWLRR